jgi:hypothetical protein
MELLNELRVALPGVQVLFAFLLTVPFTQRFNQLTSLQRDVFFAAFIAAALATALLWRRRRSTGSGSDRPTRNACSALATPPRSRA